MTAYRIVVALDLLDDAELVLEHALDQAMAHVAPELHFVTAIGPRADLDTTKRALAALVLPALDGLPTTGWTAQLHVRTGDGPAEITDLAAEVRAHLLVVGRFGVHYPLRSIGATARRVIERTTCPTLVVGLDDERPDAVAQCPQCVALRAQTVGERWFCAVHTSHDRMRLSSMMTKGTREATGLMW